MELHNAMFYGRKHTLINSSRSWRRKRRLSSLADRRLFPQVLRRSVAAGSTSSLERYKTKFPGYCAERVVLHPGNADFTGDIIYLPLYMAQLLVR